MNTDWNRMYHHDARIRYSRDQILLSHSITLLYSTLNHTTIGLRPWPSLAEWTSCGSTVLHNHYIVILYQHGAYTEIPLRSLAHSFRLRKLEMFRAIGFELRWRWSLQCVLVENANMYSWPFKNAHVHAIFAMHSQFARRALTVILERDIQDKNDSAPLSNKLSLYHFSEFQRLLRSIRPKFSILLCNFETSYLPTCNSFQTKALHCA